MHPERILITGANGFVGRHLMLHLLEHGIFDLQAVVLPSELASASAWACDNVSQAQPDPIRWQAADITAPRAAAQILREAEPDAIVHLAARASGADPDRDAVFQVNVEATRLLLEAAAAMPKPPRTLLISTGYAYGPTSIEKPAKETDPLALPGKYGAYTDSKIEMETVARNFSGFAVIARSFSHTGPGQTPSFAIPSFARQIARIEAGIEPPRIRVGNLEAMRDMLDVRDVVNAYRLILQEGAAGETYNVASGHPHKMQHLLDMLMGLVTVPIEVVEDPARLRASDIPCSTGDSSGLRRLTGWAPEISIEQTLKDTLNYWRSQ